MTWRTDVKCCLLNTPLGHNDEVTYAMNILQAAKENLYPMGGFKHLVFSSLLQPAIGDIGPMATNKLAIEERIVQSGLPYTIVNVALQMDEVITPNVVMGQRTTIPTLLDPTMSFSYISREDACNALARIIAQRSHHYYATYQLVGTKRPLGLNEIAQKVKTVLGHDVSTARLFVVDAMEDAQTGDMNTTGLRTLRDEDGVDIPPLDLNKVNPTYDQPRLDEEETAGLHEALAASSSGNEGQRKYEGPRETTMVRRHALGPAEQRPDVRDLLFAAQNNENIRPAPATE